MRSKQINIIYKHDNSIGDEFEHSFLFKKLMDSLNIIYFLKAIEYDNWDELFKDDID